MSRDAQSLPDPAAMSFEQALAELEKIVAQMERGDVALEDYGKYRYTITQSMVDDVKANIAKQQYPQPDVDLTSLAD